jgi:aquaporin Z
MALSPIGRRSGAHLNPAVTLGFFLRGHTHAHDLAGYAVAQALGAIAAAAAFAALGGHWAAGVMFARTAPAPLVNPALAVAIETALTAGLLLTVFFMLSSPATARWTPAVVTGALAVLIWAGAPYTGASMNPARTLGPDLVSGQFPSVWVYFLGPPLGASVAALAFPWLSNGRRTLTAKLFHDSRYPTTQRSALPAKPNAGDAKLN